MMRSITRLVLRLERRVSAPRAAVYRALTDPEQLAEWWGPRGFIARASSSICRLAAGIESRCSRPMAISSTYPARSGKSEPPARLAYAFRWDPPHPDDRETVVTLALGDRGEETEVRLAHGEFADSRTLRASRSRMTESFERLEQLLGEARD